MKPSSSCSRPLARDLARAGSALVVLFAASCSDTPAVVAPDPSPKLLPGEICEADASVELKLTFDPPSVVVAPGQQRPVRMTVEPDMCSPNVATLRSDNPSIAEAPPDAPLDLRHATYDFVVTGGVEGRTSIKASIPGRDPNGNPIHADAELPILVQKADAPQCASGDTVTGTLSAGAPKVQGQGALAKSYLSAPAAAFSRTDELALPAFPATVACQPDDLTAKSGTAPLRKLGPAVTFSAGAPLTMGKSLRRELEVAIPVNPAAFPPGARMRHLVVLYTGPKVAKDKPRVVPVSNPRIDADGDGFVLKFQTPWLGTFQPAVAADAGLHTHRRKLTHRAVMGISMGGGGAAIFGMRHHDQFDVIAPLGGPSDWTWLLSYIENNALGGFCPAGKTCPKVAPNLYPSNEPYTHTMDYEHWFYEKGGGNGGTFPRSEYVQIFEDLALALGNPNGSGSDPKLLHVALGPTREHTWIKGDPSLMLPDGTDCSFTLNPIGKDPGEDRQKEIEAKCMAWRCDPKNQYHADTNYFDDEYNPDGTLPVISFCDGNQDPNAQSPYVNTWAPGGNQPVNLGLAVDLNKNGIRDQGEPIIRSGHEPYDDCGPDKLCDADEPGFNAETNADPNGDDYDYMLNPTGTEGNHRWDEGERFSDFGLDGVPNTATRHIAGDVGEGDGKFTMSIGLSNFYENDPHGIISRRVMNVPGGPVTDDALKRVDILADGGVRDLFNFAAVANHLSGQIQARRGADGLPLKSVAFYNGFQFLPGEPSDKPNFFTPGAIRWADVADMPNIRYGDVDASPHDIELGDGQHVGSAPQILSRLQTSFFFVGKSWPDADRLRSKESRDDAATSTINPLGVDCEIAGHCETVFTGKRTGRTGPLAVSLPPGYATQANVDRNVRYPVLYVLHGYGQEPQDLEALAVFTNNFMNAAQNSFATRLPKFIIVYVDGRCRMRPDGKPECIRGTFYMNSARPDGAQLDDWFEEVTEYIDQSYRTMGPSEVEVND